MQSPMPRWRRGAAMGAGGVTLALKTEGKTGRRGAPPARQSAFIVSRFQFQVPVPLAVESDNCWV